jgi:electron transfer flavoprotein beta subunit
MNIIVCVKQVPDMDEVELYIEEDRKTIKTKDLIYGINESDNYAIEEAILLKEKYQGSVIVVTVGFQEADALLKKCLAKGADKAILLRDEAFKNSDAYATAKIIHSAIRDLNFDLILTGVQASDDGYMAVGVMLAELLGIPHATMVKKIGVNGETLRVNRELEAGLEEILDVNMPALLTIQTGINEPRYVSIMSLRKVSKPIDVLSLNELGLSKEEVGELGSWVKVDRLYLPPVEKEAKMLIGNFDEIAVKLVETLKERRII